MCMWLYTVNSCNHGGDGDGLASGDDGSGGGGGGKEEVDGDDGVNAVSSGTRFTTHDHRTFNALFSE